ncbi:hypothetical protein E2562_029874 [Oryza meyeriana var. granulata]|uniref:DUF834 domain-containing protein n=1 Tax=Oryza meyeriana var. granulata TaxID=110450 RepID=A0A6G1ER67_9ORYZ|nr:hypothetical protein E2562_029874 [Oryza meyeriana var. granulata]
MMAPGQGREARSGAVQRHGAARPRWEEEGVTDGNTGLNGGTGSQRRRRRLVGQNDGTTTTTSGRAQKVHGDDGDKSAIGKRSWAP